MPNSIGGTACPLGASCQLGSRRLHHSLEELLDALLHFSVRVFRRSHTFARLGGSDNAGLDRRGIGGLLAALVASFGRGDDAGHGNHIADEHQPRQEALRLGQVTGIAKDARYMEPDWARDLRYQCHDTGAALFLKQMWKRQAISADLLVREYAAV